MYAGELMKKGMIYTFETAYVIIVLFLTLFGVILFLHSSQVQPNYDLITTAKVAHDMEEDDTQMPPYGYSTSCSNANTVITYGTYQNQNDKVVCMER